MLVLLVDSNQVPTVLDLSTTRMFKPSDLAGWGSEVMTGILAGTDDPRKLEKLFVS